MARLFLIVCALACLASHVSAAGSVLALWDVVNSTRSGRSPIWANPHPTQGSPPGCTNIPTGFTPRSGQFTWAASTGQYSCNYFIFFFEPNCARRLSASGQPVGGEPAVKRESASFIIIDNFLSVSYASNIPQARSLGCAFSPPACSARALACADPNAVCVSSSLTILDRVALPANNTRLCPCKPGFVNVNGVCASPCAAKTCPTTATCRVDANNTAYCQCPDSFSYNETTNTCVDVTRDLWLAPLNQLRTRFALPALVWNTTLTENAKNWSTTLNTNQCPNAPRIALSGSPQATSPQLSVSENRAYMAGSPTEQDCVNLWVPSPTNTSNPHLFRIISSDTTQVGCGKTICPSWGTFFVCQFTKRTI